MPTDPTRAQAVFVAAAEITDPAARASFIAEACGGDLHLKSRVEALLRAHDQPDSLLDVPLVAPPGPDHAATRSFSPDPDHAATRTGGGTPGDAEKDEVPLGFLAPATRPDSLGRIGHYEILQVLGQGAFGIVFRAFDDVLHRIVAVKVLSPQMAATSPARKRFVREARSSAQVRHENVVQAYEVGEHPLPYIVMEFIPGETLQQRLDRTGPVDVAEVVRIGRQIAEGLSAAHANDLIHRDIKPGNILLESGAQRVKITDFGLARAADDASISQSGIIAGTPMYMAPEQAKGETLDQRADLFSLGSVLYQMAAGRAPFRANGTVAVLKRVAEDTPRSIREITPETPQWLCDIIAKLHAKNPDDRYQSAREVADVLADCETQLKANSKLKDFSRIPSVKPATGRRWRRKRALIIPAVVLLALVAAWAWPSVWNYTRNRGELKILPGEGLVSVIVLQNDEGVIDDNKLHPLVTDWLDVKKAQALTVPPGKYQLNVGTWPEADLVQEWEVSTSGLLNHSEIRVPVQNTSAIITVDRGQSVTLRPIMRLRPIKPISAPMYVPVAKQEPPPLAVAPFDAGQAKGHQEAWAKHLGVDVESTNSLGMKLRLIPPGQFLMGSPDDEVGREGWEGPQHKVVLTKPFYMGLNHVTVGQFKAFVKAKDYQTEAEKNGGAQRVFPDGSFQNDPQVNWQNPGFEQTDDHPVVCVSWNDTQAFLAWLSDKEGKKYALPTEAQWEYGCRAGTGTRFYSGDDEQVVAQYAWHDGNSEGRTHPVGQKKPNAWGLYDVTGNVWQWTTDWYNAGYYGKGPKEDPPGPGLGNSLLLRGGSFYDDANHSRAACRYWFSSAPSSRFTHVGFRVVQVGDLKAKKPLPPTFKNSIGIEFVIVPKGKSWLGGGKDKLGDNEVDIPSDFYLGKYEVTQEEWEKVMGETPSHYSRNGASKDAVKDISDADLKRFPVENVSWDQCQLFVAKLNKLEKETGWVYRLPKEVEWEYACRGGPMSVRDKLDSAFDFYFTKPTNTLLPEQANFEHGNGLKRTCKVGSYEPNLLGLYDMHGNVWEWCDDTEKASDGASLRVYRGGCWFNDSGYCRAADRDTRPPSFRGSNLGLRLARVPSGAPSSEVKTPPLAIAPFTDADVQRITALPAAEQVEEVRKELKRRNPGFDGKMETKIEEGVVTEFRIVTDKVTDIAPIRVFNALRVLDCSGTYADKSNGLLADLTPLEGMNLAGLTHLKLNNTKVGDAGLANFKDCKNLLELHLWNTKSTDAGLAKALAG